MMRVVAQPLDAAQPRFGPEMVRQVSVTLEQRCIGTIVKMWPLDSDSRTLIEWVLPKGQPYSLHITEVEAPAVKDTEAETLAVVLKLANERARHVMAQSDALRDALAGLLADVEEYQRINHLGGKDNHWQARARMLLLATESPC